MTQQTIALLPKIEEVDEVMRADLSRQDWIAKSIPKSCVVALAMLSLTDLCPPLPR